MLKVWDDDLLGTTASLKEEQFFVEWFEVEKRKLERCTDAGTLVRLRRTRQPYLKDGQIIYQDTERRVYIRIKPCDCIVLVTQDIAMVGEFCYDVGNRHLPIFVTEGQGMAVAYDGRLYNALANKYRNKISLQSLRLLPELALNKFH